jgi:hypothetical protein
MAGRTHIQYVVITVFHQSVATRRAVQNLKCRLLSFLTSFPNPQVIFRIRGSGIQIGGSESRRPITVIWNPAGSRSYFDSFVAIDEDMLSKRFRYRSESLI